MTLNYYRRHPTHKSAGQRSTAAFPHVTADPHEFELYFDL
jgi:hypothetical protein